MLFSPLPVPKEMGGESVQRREPCRFCDSTLGIEICPVHYWDIVESRIVTCRECGLAQFDRMPTDKEMSLGCQAYYHLDTANAGAVSRSRNAMRNYRRGLAFGSRLRKAGIRPDRMLELGPGDCYFAAGMQHAFPEMDVTVLDVVYEVLGQASMRHSFGTIHGSPESLGTIDAGRFDLIIARDILEHVADIGSVLRGVYRALNPGGYFHFLTPNGHEDMWGAYVRWKLHRQPSEILLNHVNYFDPAGLLDHLNRLGFKTVNYYLDSIKDLRRGRGWKVSDQTASSPTTGIKARETIDKYSPAESVALEAKAVLDQWWLSPRAKQLAPLYCRLKNTTIIRLPGTMRIGHEINGLMKKPT